jgi:hypothetical protein
MRTKKKMGRPPAPWVYEIVSFKMNDDQFIDVYELAIKLNVPVSSLKAFLRKANAKRKHEIQNGKARALFKVKDLKTAAKNYLKPWL